MRVKKKYVLLESLLIDVTNEFNDNEKRILKLIHKKHKDDKYNFSVFDVAAWLIEDFNLDYETAFELSKSYYWENSKLFSVYEPLRKKWPMAELFFSKIHDFTGNLVKSYNDDTYGQIEVHFNGDEGFNDVRDVRLWSGYNSMSLFIPFNFFHIVDDYRRIYIDMDDRDARTLRVDIQFFQLDSQGNKLEHNIWRTDDYENGKINLDEFLIEVGYRSGKSGDETPQKLMSFNAPYPKPLNVTSATQTLKNILEDVIQKIKSTTFQLPSGVEPIVVSVGSQLG
jgi:hypothetical protein